MLWGAYMHFSLISSFQIRACFSSYVGGISTTSQCEGAKFAVQELKFMTVSPQA